jgi:hypothetical protein
MASSDKQVNEILLALLLAASSQPTPKSSECAVGKSTDHTYWSHMNIVLEYSEPVTFLHGVVVAAGVEDMTVDGVLVEVFSRTA